MKASDSQLITLEHFPLISKDAGILDKSVKDARYGLRTFDGQTRASGYFPACPLAFGSKVPRDPSGNYWKDYEAGTGKPTYWKNWPQYTINFAVHNNGDAPIKGTLCGVGAGGLSPELTKGGIDDPLTVWSVASDPATGENLSFHFKTVDANGAEMRRSLLLSKSAAGQGTHRISVQLDFTTGQCRAWYSASTKELVNPILSAKLDLGEGHRLKAFEYGAFQLGRVTGAACSGSPADADLTWCGLALFDAPQYVVTAQSDELAAPQLRIADTKPPDDLSRYFPTANPALITHLPLSARPADLLVQYQNGSKYDGAKGFGFWMPERKPELMNGTITLRDMHLFIGSNCGADIVVAEAAHVVLENISEGGGGYHGVSSLPFPNLNRRLDVRNCRFVGQDSSLYANDQELHIENLSGGGGETFLRLVGCHGNLDNTLITGFVAADYYIKLHAGPRGGPLRISEFCVDNEGMSWVPKKACIYAEPSLNPGPGGNKLSFPGTIYTGSMSNGRAVFELAERARRNAAASQRYADR